MNKIELAAIATVVLYSVHAMPTKQEIADSSPLVAELMAPVMAEYKAKTKTAVEVAEMAIDFAGSAKSEAACYLFLRGAVNFYVKGGEFGKAADTVDTIKVKVQGVSPSEIANLISSSLDRENVRKAPRLRSQLQLAQAQVQAAKDVNRLSAQLKKVSTDDIRRQYAEALALSGKWNVALVEFAKVSGSIGKMAKVEADGSASGVDLGDFWWGYEPSYAGTVSVFRDRAADYYRKALADGKVDGLKKTLVEQRLASLAAPDAFTSAQERAQPSSTASGKSRISTAPQSGRVVTQRSRGSKKDPSGLVARWSFTDDLADSVSGIVPTKSENAKVTNGTVALRSGSPLEFAAGTVPLAPLTIQVWASATDKGLGAGGDFIFKMASSPDNVKDSVFWRWTGSKKWFSSIGGFGKEHNCYKDGSYILTGEHHLHTLTVEKDGKGMLLKFYQDDTLFGTMKTEFAWKKSPMFILGGFISPTYDEVRIYSRAFTHVEIINSLNLGPDKLPEVGKK